MNNVYPRYPTLHGNTLVFTADDDLWSVATTGGTARRLTNTKGEVTYSHFSPDGNHIAFASADDGAPDLYLIDANGGVPERLTYQGAPIHWVGWATNSDTPEIRYCSEAETPHPRTYRLWTVTPGGQPQLQDINAGSSLSENPDGTAVLLRSMAANEPAKWKRYKGGVTGQIWIDRHGTGDFQHLSQLAGNIDHTQLIGDRIYYLSDFQGIGNIYSCLLDGTDVRRHTDHDTFYARNLSSDGQRIAYHCGGELYIFDPDSDSTTHVEVTTGASQPGKARRFASPGKYLRAAALSPDGSHVAVNARGKLFALDNWHGPAVQLGDVDGVGYREPTYLRDGNTVVAVASSFERDDHLVRLPLSGGPAEVIELGDVGRVLEIVPSPVDDRVVFTNHRRELVLADLAAGQPEQRVLFTAAHTAPKAVSFSPDGHWLVFETGQTSPDGTEGRTTHEIFLCEVETGRVESASDAVLSDEKPVFDPDSRFLYFVGRREFAPLMDAMHRDMSFAWGTRPYAVMLRKDTPAPFLGHEVPIEGNRIDLEGLVDRVVGFPVEPGSYEQVIPVPGRVLLLSTSLYPASIKDLFERFSRPDKTLTSVDITTGKVETVAENVTSAQVSADGKRLMYRSGQRLRVIDLDVTPTEDEEPSPESGWIDLDRIKLSVTPSAEWPQMFAESWRLQRDHFWMEHLGGLDWPAMFERYAPLLPRLATRSEFADLLSEINGELGTSHAYTIGGDYAAQESYSLGYLAASFALVEGTYRITEIAGGDQWRPEATSPLRRPGVNAEVGEEVLAVNGMPVGTEASVEQRLVNLAEAEVQLTLRSVAGEIRTVSVRTLSSTRPARYRDWVNTNRRLVHEATQGRVGYVHIPDMMADGFGEFYRSFLAEQDREALVVDLRHNGGGFISQVFMDRLAKERVGHRFTRNNLPVSKPWSVRRGPLVGITDEWAGSDGDIGSHTFSSRGLGPLIGTRTWGGVVGILVRFRLADDTVVTQPESASHFDDVGWGIENFGAVPDIEVKYPPQDYVEGRDPQLSAAIENILEQLETAHVSRFSASPFPDLRFTGLPPRPQDQ